MGPMVPVSGWSTYPDRTAKAASPCVRFSLRLRQKNAPRVISVGVSPCIRLHYPLLVRQKKLNTAIALGSDFIWWILFDGRLRHCMHGYKISTSGESPPCVMHEARKWGTSPRYSHPTEDCSFSNNSETFTSIGVFLTSWKRPCYAAQSRPGCTQLAVHQHSRAVHSPPARLSDTWRTHGDRHNTWVAHSWRSA